jgi:catechol 2,3-dioxygenase
MGVISGIGHVALQVRNLSPSLDVARNVMGLREVEVHDGWTFMTEGAPHHSIQYREGPFDAVDHIGLLAPSVAALAELKDRLHRERINLVSLRPLDSMLERGIVFVGPHGFTFEVYVGMPYDQPPHFDTVGIRPRRFGHVNIACDDTDEMADFFCRVLDFRVSDHAEAVWFLRCNVDHHGLALLPGGAPRLHHHAWEVPSIAELVHLADVLAERGEDILWGPVRHGMGRNIALYFSEPGGSIVEYYCQMERIYDDESYSLVEWDLSGHEWYSLWAPGLPTGFIEQGVKPVPR